MVNPNKQKEEHERHLREAREKAEKVETTKKKQGGGFANWAHKYEPVEPEGKTKSEKVKPGRIK
jgi:hypothetical protein